MISTYSTFFTFVIASLGACTKSEKITSEEGHHDDAAWEEMDTFHQIMAEAFHPYKDSANLAPAKYLADELSREAELWNSAPLPHEVNNDEMKARLNQLREDTRALSMMVQDSASDEEIGKKLDALHGGVHRIMEEWNASSKVHHH